MPHDNDIFNFLMDKVIIKGSLGYSNTAWLGRKSSYMSGCSNQWLDGSPVDMKFRQYGGQNCDWCHGKTCCTQTVWNDGDHNQTFFSECNAQRRSVCILRGDFISKFEKLISDSHREEFSMLFGNPENFFELNERPTQISIEPISQNNAVKHEAIKTSDPWTIVMFVTVLIVMGILIVWTFRLKKQLKSRAARESMGVSFNGRDASIVHPKINNNLNEQSSVCMKISEQ